MQLDTQTQSLVGQGGSLPVHPDDEITRKLAMLIEGECEGLGPLRAAEKFGFSKQRYFQLRKAFQAYGAPSLRSRPRGPKTNYRRTNEVVRQVIRHRFLDPEASPEVIGQRLRQSGQPISTRSVERVIAEYGLQKKLYECRPRRGSDLDIEIQRTRRRTRKSPCDPLRLERGVRQLLADKVQGNLLGLWLLAAEHLRLGTWDLRCGWTGQPTERVEPRLALQLVHEAVICTSGFRSDRSLTQGGGFELANGLPFVASDTARHELLAQHTMHDAIRLQVAIGKIRRASGHFRGKLLAIDPHRVSSYSKRHMRMHVEKKSGRPTKMAQTFWVLDADTQQPVCFTTATASRTVAQATPPLLDLAASSLDPQPGPVLVVADAEHFNAELVDEVHRRTGFDLLVPMPNQPAITQRLKSIAAEQFRPRWAGYATTKRPYQMARSDTGSCSQFIQRSGERPEDWRFKAFLCTTDRDEVDALTLDFPKRWHVEEFFNANQALGWKRAGTLNLNIRYGQMTMALLAQAVIHQLRTRLGEPVRSWDANHLAKDFFCRLDGDVRVDEDTIVVTYYNAPNESQLREHYENLPHKLREENIDPRVPWLYGFKLDFRFR